MLECGCDDTHRQNGAGAVETAKTLAERHSGRSSGSGMSLCVIASKFGRAEMLKALLSEKFYGRNQDDEKEFTKRVIEIAESKDSMV